MSPPDFLADRLSDPARRTATAATGGARVSVGQGTGTGTGTGTGATSPSVLRTMNAASVLRLAWTRDVVTASDLVAETGLSRSTVIGVCDDLLDRGWFTLLPDARSTDAYRKGRPARRWALAHRAGLVVGVDAGQHHVTARVADLHGTTLGQAEVRLPADLVGAAGAGAGGAGTAPTPVATGGAGPTRASGPAVTDATSATDPARSSGPLGAHDAARVAGAHVIATDPEDAARRDAARREAVAGVVRDALADADATEDAVLAIVVGVPAPVDAAGRSPVEVASDFWLRMNPSYVDRLALGRATVVVENDANLAALAETDAPHGLGTGSSVTLLAGERFGAGLVLDGGLRRGARGAAGEMRLLDLVEGVGSSDGIGAVLRDWAREDRAAGRVPDGTPLAAVPVDDLAAPAVLAAADAGDPTALALVERLAQRLARIGAVLSGLLDVDRIVVAGAVAPSIGLLVSRTTPHLAALSYRQPPEVLASRLGEHVVTVGAVARALAHVREHALELALPGAARA